MQAKAPMTRPERRGALSRPVQGRDHSMAHAEAINVRTPQVPGVPQACHTGRWLEVDNGYQR